MQIYALQFAGIILLCIVSANFFAPQKMRWTENLKNVELIFKQVFVVHCVFLVACVFAMGLVCIMLPHQLLKEPMGRLLLGFMAVFWTARVCTQFFYYDSNIKREYPVFNILFGIAFLYLAIIFNILLFI